MQRLAVVGGGPAGVAAAWAAARAAQQVGVPLSITLYEAGDTVGGWLTTSQRDGFVMEGGARGMRTRGVSGLSTLQMIADIPGLADDMLVAAPAASSRYVAYQGALHAVPTSLTALLSWPPLSGLAGGIVRDLLAPLLFGAPRTHTSLAAALQQTMGPTFVQNVLDAITAGVYAAPADQLSARTAFAAIGDLLASGHGSLFWGTLASMLSSGARASSAVMPAGIPDNALATSSSFKSGLSQLPTAAAAYLQQQGLCNVRTSCQIQQVQLDGATGQLYIESDSGVDRVDRAILACPAPASAKLLQRGPTEAVRALAAAPRSSVVAVTCGWHEQVPEQAVAGHSFGWLAPASQRQHACLGVVHDTSTYPGQNPGSTVMTAMLGGAGSSVASQASDEEVIAAAQAVVQAYSWPGAPEPASIQVSRALEAIPLYSPGTVEGLRAAREAVHAWSKSSITLAGNSYDGVGVPDAVHSGVAAGQAAVSAIAGSGAGR